MSIKAQNSWFLISAIFVFTAASCPQKQSPEQAVVPETGVTVDSASQPVEVTDAPISVPGDSLKQLETESANKSQGTEKMGSEKKGEVHKPMPENRLPKDKERLEKERKKREKGGG